MFGVNRRGNTSAGTGRRLADCDRWNGGRREFGPRRKPADSIGSPAATLESLDDGATLQGNTGCNGYSGTYEADHEGGPTLLMFLGMVSFGITEGGCPTRELLQREVAYQDTHAQTRTPVAQRWLAHGSPSPARPARFWSWTGGGSQGVV